MTNRATSGGPIKLSVGDVITASLRIYRDHFKPYLLVSLQGYLWLLPAGVITAGVVAVLAALERAVNEIALAGMIVAAIAFLLVPWGYCLGKLVALQGVLARLVFFEVGEQPETVAAAKIQLMPRFWRFLWISLLSSLIFFLFFIPIGLGYGILIGFFAWNFAGGDPTIAATIALILLMIAWTFISFYIYIWAFARLALVDVCLAMEPTLSPTKAIGRSWALTKGYVLSLQLIFFLAFLITLPLSAFTNIGTMGTVILGIDQTWGSLIDIPLGLIVSILIVPFWQAIKALVYYDLRTRKEGLNLSLDLPPVDTI